MKKIIRYISGMMLAGALMISAAACSPDDFPSVNEAGIPVVADYEETIKVWVDQETNYAHFEFTGAKGVYPVWIIDGKSYSSSHHVEKYYRKAGDYTVEVKIANANGMGDGTITKTFHIDKTRLSGFGGFVYDGEFNMWKGATVEEPTFYYAPGWAQIADPVYSLNAGAYSVNLPQSTTDQWQAQMMLNTDIALEAGKSYDGSIILTSSKEHSSITWKVCEVGDDNNILYDSKNKIAVKAGEPLCVWFSDMPCEKGISKVKVVFDFGGNAEKTEIIIEDFVIKDHADDDGTVVPKVDTTPEPAWVAVDSKDNLWNATAADLTFDYHYAPGWVQIAAPSLTTEGRAFSLVFTEATAERWQNQFKILTTLTSDTETVYDFRLVLKSSEDIAGVTVKLVQSGGGENDKNYFFEERIDLVADVETAFWKSSVKAINAMDAITLVLDFGGNPANTNVTIKDIILQKHKD